MTIGYCMKFLQGNMFKDYDKLQKNTNTFLSNGFTTQEQEALQNGYIILRQS